MAHLRILGQLSVSPERGAAATAIDKKPLLVPGLLAYRRAEWLNRDELAMWIWPDAADPKASLRTALTWLRGLGAVHVQGTRVSLDPSVTVDVWEFEAAVAVEDWARAAELFTGAPFGSMLERRLVPRELARELEAEGDRLLDLREMALERLAARLLEEGDADGAAEAARRLAALAPYRQTAPVLLVTALQQAGRAEEALAYFRDHRRRLAEEEEEPSAELRALGERLERSARVRLVTPPAQPANARQERKRRSWARAVAAGAMLLLIGATGAAMLLRPPDPWPRDARLEIPVALAETAPEDHGPGVPTATLALDARGARMTDTLRLPTDFVLLSADGRHVGVEYREHGADILLYAGPGERGELLKSDRADEKPLASSPGGERLLYRSGRSLGEGRYEVELRWMDMETRRDVSLLRFDRQLGLGANWSPDGTLIALWLHQPPALDSVVILNVRGERVRGIAGRVPAWAPMSDRLAYAVPGAGGVRLRSVDRDGLHAQTHAVVPGNVHSLAWITSSLLLLVADVGVGGDVWVVDLRTRRFGQVTESRSVTGLARGATARPPPNWLESIPLGRWSRDASGPGGFVGAVSALTLETGWARHAGEYFRAEARLTWLNGASARVDPGALAWALPPEVEMLEPGLFRASRPGSYTLRADYHGAVDGALEIEVGPSPASVGLTTPVGFAEDWTDPTRAAGRWRFFGDPPHQIDPDGGPGWGTFTSGGDADFANGAISARRFATRDGLTLEVEGLAPLTGELFQDFVLGFALEAPALGSHPDRWPAEHGIIVDMARGVGFADRSRGQPRVPLPEPLDRWRRYALQLEPEGTAALLVDGAVHHRWPLLTPLPDSLHVFVGGVTLTADLRHGPVRLYEGLRYRLSN